MALAASHAARAGVTGDLVTLAEAARIARVRPGTVRSWCSSGILECLGGTRRGDRRVRRSDIERVARSRRRRPSVPTAPSPAVPRQHEPGWSPRSARPPTVGGEALQRLAADLSEADPSQLFDDVLDDSIRLFLADRAGLWLWRPGAEYPLAIAATRNMPEDLLAYVRCLPATTRTAGVRALESGAVVVYDDAADPRITRPLRALYQRSGIRTVCFVPIVYRGDPLGLLVLYHGRPHAWTAEERGLARSFGNSIATAIGNARLADSVRDLAARLRSIQDLTTRVNGLQDVQEIGDAIVAEAGSLIRYDTIRVYRVDHQGGWCEPIAFAGTFLGTANPTPDMLRVRIGTGLTGWVAANDEPLRVGDTAADGRSVLVGPAEGPESMLVVPMSSEGAVHGVIVLSRRGRDQFTDDDQTTMSIFAGHAAQALVNAARLDQLRRQQQELQHQVASQRRLLAVNEKLLSTLDASGVLELIADSLKAVVAYDSLTIYRVDRDRGVRRPVIARDRFADVILGYEAPLGSGITGWAVDHREAVLANDALTDPRSIQIPGTPSEPESMIVVPLVVEGEVLGTLNIGRMGMEESHFSQNEFELTKLFAGQAAIALRNADTHGEVKVQAERDALTGLRNHGTFQRELGRLIEAAGDRSVSVLMMDLDQFKAYNDTFGHPAGDGLLARVARAIEVACRSTDHVYRYGGDEFAVILPGVGRSVADDVAERIRSAVAALETDPSGPMVSISVGTATYPEDGTRKDEVVEAADVAMYLAKDSGVRAGPRDPFLAALDETAGALLEGSRLEDLFDTILNRAARLLGTPHAYLYLVDAEADSLVVRAGLGLFESYAGYRMSIDRGLAGAVYRSRQAVAVDDYDTFEGRSPDFVGKRVGAVLGVPLTSAGRVVGVIGLATGSNRVWRQPEVDAVMRFAQLASIAIENARLQEAAGQHPADPITGLPARQALISAVGAALQPVDAGVPGQPVSVLLLGIDRFKVINETLGHAAGDQALREVGKRLASVLGPTDFVARFGGDEFGVILRGADPERVAQLTDAALTTVQAPLELDGRTWFISVSIGVATAEPGAKRETDLLREAEVALVQAQDDHTRVAWFDPVRSREALERIELEADLRAALEHDELIAAYQPIIDLRSEQVVGFEALVRWQHPRRGIVPPAAFIPLAEETNLIVPLGLRVLEIACRQAQAWRQAWPDKAFLMSVNLSPRQFSDPNLVASIAEVLRATGLEPSALELEITETSVMDRSEAGLKALADLRALGVKLVLDDFGTGWSSLAYLRDLPLDTIKIDRAFVTDLGPGDPNVAIVQAVLTLAHGLGISVVAEGVERRIQARRLKALGCDLGQGFTWSRPATPEAIEAALRDDARDPGAPRARGQRRPPSSRSRNRNRLTKSR